MEGVSKQWVTGPHDFGAEPHSIHQIAQPLFPEEITLPASIHSPLCCSSEATPGSSRSGGASQETKDKGTHVSNREKAVHWNGRHFSGL